MPVDPRDGDKDVRRPDRRTSSAYIRRYNRKILRSSAATKTARCQNMECEKFGGGGHSDAPSDGIAVIIAIVGGDGDPRTSGLYEDVLA